MSPCTLTLCLLWRVFINGSFLVAQITFEQLDRKCCLGYLVSKLASVSNLLLQSKRYTYNF